MKKFFLFLIIFLCYKANFAQEIYFPPTNNDQWEQSTFQELAWDDSKLNEFYQFLEDKNSRAFILLKDGKIVIEKYFGNHKKDSNWYWASAGKTLTAATVGIAQEEGLLDINDKSSDYLGENWTSLPKEKQDLITVWHQLTMTTGLDYEVDNRDCTDPECLQYKEDAGTQWWYHNAPYTLLESVVESASGLNYNQYFFPRIRNKIGMNGAWVKTGWNNVYYSTARSMARFGILMLNNGDWEDEAVIEDKQYIYDMVNTSQELNESYGYLWWLNGKSTYRIPQVGIEFEGMMVPNAPKDTYAALGKNGQCLVITPSEGIVWVRMGDSPDEPGPIGINITNDVWEYLNEIISPNSSVQTKEEILRIHPNPASDYIEINTSLSHFGKGGSELASRGISEIEIFNMLGEKVITTELTASNKINVSQLPTGMYIIKIGDKVEKFVKK